MIYLLKLIIFYVNTKVALHTRTPVLLTHERLSYLKAEI